jgi:hypothetical protein
MPLAGLTGTLTFENFIDILKVYHKESNDEIRILAYVSDLMPQVLFDMIRRSPIFNVTDLGDIIEVKADKADNINSKSDEETVTLSYEDESKRNNNGNTSVYYCHYNHKRGLLLCFTSDTLEDAGRTMDRFVGHTKGIFPLWIHPVTFDRIRRQILNNNPNSIISEFHASRFRTNNEDVIRDNYEQRYFKYLGDDGRYALDELSSPYGVLPTSIVFNILNVYKFRITTAGRFAFAHGSLDFLFDTINEILSKVLETKAVIQRAKIEFIPVNMGRKEIKLPKVVPLDIVFSREVEFTEMEKLIDNMTGEDFNFDIFDMSLISGSIHLSGTIIDKNKNIAFNITGNSEKITLSPRKDTGFDSMMRFYKMISERLDVKAEVKAPANPIVNR